MNKFFYPFAAIVMALGLLFSCQEPVTPQNPENPENPGGEDRITLEVEPADDIVFNAAGNEDKVLTVTTNAESWSFEKPEWVIAEKEENTLKVNVTDNTPEEGERTGEIVFSAGEDLQVKVNVRQAAAELVITLSVTPETLEPFAPTGGDAQLTVETNAAEWSYTVPEWVTAEKAENTLNLSTGVNNIAERSGEVVITAGDKMVSVAVSQPKLVDNKKIRNIYVCEMKDANPLNVLAYKYNDGTYFFDAIAFFSSNIRYDSDNDDLILYHNPHVQGALDNPEIISKIKKAGIKVYLSVLGDHTAAGICNLTAAGAESFSNQVLDVVNSYNLDGVFLDDEYTQSGSAPAGSAVLESKASRGAAARFCKTLKGKLGAGRDLVVFGAGQLQLNNISDYYFEQMFSELGMKAGEFMDYYIPSYNSSDVISPAFLDKHFSDMKREQFGGYSIECHKKSEDQLKKFFTENKVRSLINDRYGWIMWFALTPDPASNIENLKKVLPYFNVTAKGQDMTLQMPTEYYVKIGDSQYEVTPKTFEPGYLPSFE